MLQGKAGLHKSKERCGNSNEVITEKVGGECGIIRYGEERGLVVG